MLNCYGVFLLRGGFLGLYGLHMPLKLTNIAI